MSSRIFQIIFQLVHLTALLALANSECSRYLPPASTSLNQKFMFSVKRLAIDEADAECQTHYGNQNGRLAVIDSDAELRVVEQLFKEYGYTNLNYWVSAQFVQRFGKFQWTTTKVATNYPSSGDWLDDYWEYKSTNHPQNGDGLLLSWNKGNRRGGNVSVGWAHPDHLHRFICQLGEKSRHSVSSNTWSPPPSPPRSYQDERRRSFLPP